jgi:hypothetical protein
MSNSHANAKELQLISDTNSDFAEESESDSDAGSDITNESLIEKNLPAIDANAKKTALTLPQWITKLSETELIELIKTRSRERCGDDPKEIQISYVMELVKRRNSFVLAGMGRLALPRCSGIGFPSIRRKCCYASTHWIPLATIR